LCEGEPVAVTARYSKYQPSAISHGSGQSLRRTKEKGATFAILLLSFVAKAASSKREACEN
jgi:hypothetical protein